MNNMNSHAHPLLFTLALLCLASPSVGTAQTDTVAPTNQPSVADLKKLAMGYEAVGEKQKAAEAYEQLIKVEPGFKLVLGNRLVKLYAETGQTEKALTWARMVMERNPDPQAYLAGVFAMCGQPKKAKAILGKEIRSVRLPRRKVTLHWQLADILEKEGNLSGAEDALMVAADAARGTPEARAATRRIKVFHGKHKRRGQTHGPPGQGATD